MTHTKQEDNTVPENSANKTTKKNTSAKAKSTTTVELEGLLDKYHEKIINFLYDCTKEAFSNEGRNKEKEFALYAPRIAKTLKEHKTELFGVGTDCYDSDCVSSVKIREICNKLCHWAERKSKGDPEAMKAFYIKLLKQRGGTPYYYNDKATNSSQAFESLSSRHPDQVAKYQDQRKGINAEKYNSAVLEAFNADPALANKLDDIAKLRPVLTYVLYNHLALADPERCMVEAISINGEGRNIFPVAYNWYVMLSPVFGHLSQMGFVFCPMITPDLYRRLLSMIKKHSVDARQKRELKERLVFITNSLRYDYLESIHHCIQQGFNTRVYQAIGAKRCVSGANGLSMALDSAIHCIETLEIPDEFAAANVEILACGQEYRVKGLKPHWYDKLGSPSSICLFSKCVLTNCYSCGVMLSNNKAINENFLQNLNKERLSSLVDDPIVFNTIIECLAANLGYNSDYCTTARFGEND